MSFRQLLLSAVRKRCYHFSLQARNIACLYVDKFNNPNQLGNSIIYNEITNHRHNLQVIKRFKHNKKQTKKSKEEQDEESDDEDDDIEQDKNLPVLSLKVNSLRVDLVLKAGLNMARNKIETAFYESKIRVNGRKVLKKSEQVRIGDEIDLIRGPSPTNPDFLLVSRVTLLNAKENADNLSVKLTRNKSLIIENYEDPWNSEIS